MIEQALAQAIAHQGNPLVLGGLLRSMQRKGNQK
jgi:hypothetical protein